MIAGCSLGWPNAAIPRLLRHETEIEATPEEISWMVSALDFGNAVGPLPICYLADRFGRKVGILISSGMYLTSWLLLGIAKVPVLLYIGRFCAGLGKGVTFAVVPMFIGEIASTPIRGALCVVFGVALYVGTTFEYVVGPMVSFHIMILLSGILPLVLFATIPLVPESPYFLLMKGKEGEARKSLQWYRNTDHLKTKAQTEDELKEMKISVEKEMKNKGSFMDLFKLPGNRRAATIVVALALLQRFGGVSPLLSYASITLPETDGLVGPNAGSVIFSVTLLVTSIMASLLMDRTGRRLLLIMSSIITGLAMLTSAIFYYLFHKTNADMSAFLWVPYVSLLSFGIGYPIGMGIVPAVFVGEIFPTDVKAHAAALSSIGYAVGSFVCNKMYITIEASIGVYVNYLFYSFVSLITFLFTLFFVFETKGRTFVDIQRRLNQDNSLFETKL